MQRASVVFGSGALVLGILASCGPLVVVSDDEDGGEGGDAPQGSSGGYGNGGAAPAAGNGSGAGLSGTGGRGTAGAPTGPTEADLALDVGCDFIPILQQSCATTGCHRASSIASVTAAGLSLSGGYVNNLKDVPATFGDIYCGNEPCAEPPASCPTGQLLIDSSDWTKSRMWTSITNTNGCGDIMPIGVVFAADELACYQAFLQTIADLP